MCRGSEMAYAAGAYGRTPAEKQRRALALGLSWDWTPDCEVDGVSETPVLMRSECVGELKSIHGRG
jgi:hypothetical protein